MNRLVRVVADHAEAHPPLAALRMMLVHCAHELNAAWADYRRARAKKGGASVDRELSRFVQRWRPVVILLVPGAAERLGELPPRGGRCLTSYAEVLVSLVREEPDEERLTATLEAELRAIQARAFGGESYSDAEDAARFALSDAAQRANIVLFHGLDALRACVGEDSAVYRDFAVDLPWDRDVLDVRPNVSRERVGS